MENNQVKTSTGVVFRLKSPALWAVTAVEEELAPSEPQPPKIFIESKGREEINEGDPNYIAAWQAWQSKVTQRRYEVLVATGTEVVSLPDGLLAHTDDWRSPLLAIGVPVSDNPHRAYIDWLKLVAAPTLTDWRELYLPLMKLTGVLEEDVAAALATFRSVPERGADNGGSTAGDGADGVGIREPAAGPRADVRRRRS